jgi:hypothetical protein
MTAEKPMHVQPIELLGVTEGMANEQPVIVVSIRPDPANWRPHNIVLSKRQATRLLTDLGNLLRVPVVLLLGCVLAGGCSARIENSTGTTATGTSTTEDHRTRVELDFQPRTARPQPPLEPQSSPEPPRPASSEAKPLTISGNTVIFNIRGGDTHYHSDTHVHIDEQPQVRERIVIRREVTEPPRQVDPRCEQLRAEHERRVAEWRSFPLGK